MPSRCGCGCSAGALGLFGAAPGTLNDADLRFVRGLAHVASLAIVRAGRPPDRVDVLTALRAAVAGRAAVEMAKAVLAGTHAVDTEEAFRLLRDYAHRQHRHLTDVTRAIVAGGLAPISIPGAAAQQTQP